MSIRDDDSYCGIVALANKCDGLSFACSSSVPGIQWEKNCTFGQLLLYIANCWVIHNAPSLESELTFTGGHSVCALNVLKQLKGVKLLLRQQLVDRRLEEIFNLFADGIYVSKFDHLRKQQATRSQNT